MQSADYRRSETLLNTKQSFVFPLNILESVKFDGFFPKSMSGGCVWKYETKIGRDISKP